MREAVVSAVLSARLLLCGYVPRAKALGFECMILSGSCDSLKLGHEDVGA